jgi:exonuclease SbcD
MKLLHTSDWHLGRLFHERSLLEDQAHALRQLIEVLKEERPDALLVAGDLFDRPLPPQEAIQLLDDVLSEIVLGLKIPTLLISGNHDSARRVSFGSRFQDPSLIRIIGTLEGMHRPLTLRDDHGEVDLHGIPYFSAPELKVLAQEDLKDPEQALSWCVRTLLKGREDRGRAVPAVAVAHAFIANASSSDSENRLSIGGSEQVPASVFDPFIYTALGHLHRPQSPTPRVRYSGSLLPYHFTETNNGKSFTIVELGKDRTPVIREIPVSPLRKLRIIEGTFEELLELGKREPSNDYVLARRKYDGPRIDVMRRLRQSFPNLLEIELLLDSTKDVQRSQNLEAAVRAKKDPASLFRDFFLLQNETPLSDDLFQRVQAYFGEES